MARGTGSPRLVIDALAPVLSPSPGTEREEGAVTNDSVVEVVRQHPLTHSNQQPEGFLLLGVQQQNGGQDVHGLLRGRGGVTGVGTVTDQTVWPPRRL